MAPIWKLPAALALCFLVLWRQSACALDVQEIMNLLDAGVNEQAIIRIIERQGSAPSLDGDAIASLRHHGATDELLRLLLKENEDDPK